MFAMVLCIMLGVTGCMGNNKTAQMNAETERAMLDYLQETYDQTFVPVTFIPAWRGFNDSMNESILVAQGSEGFCVNIRERVHSPGKFYDNYVNALASWYADKGMDYSRIEGLSAAKTYMYINQDLDAAQMDVLRAQGIEFLRDVEGSFSCLIALEKTFSEQDLEPIYEIYQLLNAIGRRVYMRIAFSASGEKSEEYVNQFPLQLLQWPEVDSSLSHYALISDAGLSFAEFSNQVENWEDMR